MRPGGWEGCVSHRSTSSLRAPTSRALAPRAARQSNFSRIVTIGRRSDTANLFETCRVLLPGQIERFADFHEDIALDYQQLQRAINIRDRSYELLLWLTEEVGKGTIPLSRVANHSGGPAAVTDWLRTFGFVIPVRLRPAEAEMEAFAAFFSTYLTSSFDVVSKPGTRGEGPISGCACEICARIVSAPHLQAKKLTRADKQRADFLMIESLAALASEHQLVLDEDFAEKTVLAPATRRACAYLSYGDWLIRRLAGESDGPAVLALWRLVAWDTRGGQRRGFELKLADFRLAETKLLAIIRDNQRA